VQIALMQGSKAEIDFRSLLLKRVTLTGSTLRPRSVEEKTKIAQALQKNVWPLLESGAIRPIIHETFPLKQASEAHHLMEAVPTLEKFYLSLLIDTDQKVSFAAEYFLLNCRSEYVQNPSVSPT